MDKKSQKSGAKNDTAQKKDNPCLEEEDEITIMQALLDCIKECYLLVCIIVISSFLFQTGCLRPTIHNQLQDARTQYKEPERVLD